MTRRIGSVRSHLVFGEWLADAFTAGDTGALGLDPTLAIEISQVLDADRAHRGSAAAGILPAVP